MINSIFDACVYLLVFLANNLGLTSNNLGLTYKAINVWIFVVIWPIVTAVLIVLVFLQQLQIRKLSGRREKAE